MTWDFVGQCFGAVLVLVTFLVMGYKYGVQVGYERAIMPKSSISKKQRERAQQSSTNTLLAEVFPRTDRAQRNSIR